MPVMDNGVLILSLSPKIVRSSRSCQDRFVMLFSQTFLNYQDFKYPNVSNCLSLLVKTAATFASLKLSLLTQRGNRSKNTDRTGVVRTEFANVLKLDFTANSVVHFRSTHLCSCLHPCFSVNCLILCSCHVFSDIFLPYFVEFSIMLILSLIIN